METNGEATIADERGTDTACTGVVGAAGDSLLDDDRGRLRVGRRLLDDHRRLRNDDRRLVDVVRPERHEEGRRATNAAEGDVAGEATGTETDPAAEALRGGVFSAEAEADCDERQGKSETEHETPCLSLGQD